MYCRNCGEQIENNTKFCRQCGTPNNIQPINKPHNKSNMIKFLGIFVVLIIIFYCIGSLYNDGKISLGETTEIISVNIPISGGEIKMNSGGKITSAGTQASNIADAKTDYTTGDLDAESEIIAAINTTNTKINSILTALEGVGLIAGS